MYIKNLLLTVGIIAGLSLVTISHAVTNLTANAGNNSISLDWEDAGTPGFDHYTVYRSATSGSGFAAITNVPSSYFTDNTAVNDTTYYYVVTTTDTLSNESPYSVEVSATPLADATGYSLDDRMNWWYNDRFGMFIHFGSYSSYGSGEWEMWDGWWSKQNYQTQISQNFNPVDFDANAIVTLAKNAGMKYLVITAKHHEGLAMWDTAVSGFKDYTGTINYDLYDYCGWSGSDILGDLKAECDAQGIKFCLYYSILDWNHPSQLMSNTGAWPEGFYSTMQDPAGSPTWQDNKAAYIADMKAQLAELITAYDPAILWFDGDWCANLSTPTASQWWNDADAQDLYDYCMSLKSDLVINERVKRDLGMGDYACAEFGVPASPMERQWERCETMNGAWGYDTGFEGSYYPSATMIQQLVTCVSRDGNYLLNIGPKGDGTVTAGSVSILQDFAAWMATNEDSIRGCIRSPFTAKPSFGCFTAKSGKLFAHVFNWPGSGTLSVPRVANTIARIYSMDDPGTDLSYTISGSTIDITVPVTAPDASDSVICIEVVGGMPVTAAVLTPIPIVNGTFDAETAKVDFDNAGSVTGWTAVGGGTALDSGVEGGDHAFFASTTHNGDLGAYQMTGYTIQAGDQIQVSFDAWNIYGGLKMTVSLFGGTVGNNIAKVWTDGEFTQPGLGGWIDGAATWDGYAGDLYVVGSGTFVATFDTTGFEGQELGITLANESDWTDSWGGIDNVILSVVSLGIPVSPNEYIISGYSISGGTNLALTVSNSVVGHAYGIRITDTLTPPDWTPTNVVTKPGTGSNLTFDLPIVETATNRFYKLDVQQQ